MFWVFCILLGTPFLTNGKAVGAFSLPDSCQWSLFVVASPEMVCTLLACVGDAVNKNSDWPLMLGSFIALMLESFIALITPLVELYVGASLKCEGVVGTLCFLSLWES